MDNKDIQWNELFEGALPIILRYMKSASPSPRDHERADIAMRVLSNVTRHEATMSHKESTRVAAAHLISQNPQEAAEYLRVSTPTLQISGPKK